MLKKLLISAVSLIIMLALLEIGVRIVAPGSYHNQNSRAYDAKIGYKFLPNLNTTIDTGRGINRMITNEYGFVGESFSMEKPKGEWRIANIGDSYTEGLQEVSWDENYVALLGKWLTANASSTTRTYRSLNFGISGRGTLEEYWSYEYFVKEARPDLVILWFTLSNDLGNNYLPPQTPEALATNAYGKIKYLLKQSALFSFIFERVKGNPIALKLMQRAHLTNAIAEPNGADQVSFQDKINYSTDPEDSAKQAQAFTTTEDLLVRFKQSVEQSGGEFLVVLIPHFVHEEDFAKTFLTLYPSANLEMYDFKKPMTVLKDMFKKSDIAFYDLTDDFVAYEAHQHRVLKDCGAIFGDHFTPCGHRLTAEIIGSYIQEHYVRRAL